MKTVKVTERALNVIFSTPLLCEYLCDISIDCSFEVVGTRKSIETDEDYLELKYKDIRFLLRAALFDIDLEAYKAELEAENKKREIQRLEKKREQDRKEFLECYGWDDLRCKAAVAAMQGFIINGIHDTDSKEDNMKYLVSASVQVATALVKELQETV